MPSGFRSIPSTEQRLEALEGKIDEIAAKLDIVLDYMTKTTQHVKLPEATITVKRENLSPDVRSFLEHWAKKPPTFGPARPAALDVDDSYCALKVPTGTEHGD